MDLVSVIIPVYNSEKYLKNLLDSVIKQDYSNLEIMVINDGSSDATSDILNIYDDNRMKVFNIDNHGVSYARNIGIDNARGKYIVFFDSDDFVDNNYISKLVETISNLDIGIMNYYINDKKAIKRKINSMLNNVNIVNEILRRDSIKGFLFNKIFLIEIIKRENLRFIYGMHMCEDLLFCLQYMTYVKHGKYLNDCGYHYYVRELSLSNKISEKMLTVFDGYKSVIEICQKYNMKFKRKAESNYIMILTRIAKKTKDNNANLNKDICFAINNYLYSIKYKNMFNIYIPIKYRLYLLFFINKLK